MCMRPLNFFSLGIDMGTSRSKYEYCISRSIVNNNFFLPFYSTMIYLKIPRDKCTHPMRSKDMEWRNLGFPTIGIRALG